MKKFFCFTLGGIKQKIFNLVLIFLLAVIGCYGAVSLYQSRQLNKIVSEAKEKQQAAIRSVSEQTMNQVIESTMTKTTGLQAYIADNIFAEVKNNLVTLRNIAGGIFSNSAELQKRPFSLPDPQTQGFLTAQVLYEKGVDPQNSEYLGYAVYLTDVMKGIISSSDKIENCYIGFCDGTHLCVDADPKSKFDSNGEQIPFPVRQRPWYTGAAEAGDIYFTDIEDDTYSDKKVITCAAPLKINGTLIGVIGVDITLDSIDSYVKDSYSNGGFVCVINNAGRVIFAPKDNGIFDVASGNSAPDLRQSENKELASFISDAISSRTGLRTVTVNGKEYYAAGSPLATIGWTAVSIVDKELTEQPTKLMIEEYDEINKESTETFEKESSRSKQTILVLTLVVLILGLAGALTVSTRIVKPIETMTSEIMECGKTGKNFEMKKAYRTDDEIEVLALAFDDLSKKTKQYIIDITRITKEKERIGTELELARKIQADMLPNIYPAFPDRPEFDIYATMNPAKEVGGDFYDFFLIDDDHLGIVMADVSGKGVPAALFMMMSKILIHNFAMMGSSPAKVLEQTNTTICQNNEEGMFVTVWFGVFEISTGKMTAANAGHEYPVLRKAGGEYELFKDKHGFVIGGMEGIKYKEYEIQFEKGDSMFLYTDGVPEATDSKEEMFGTDRLVETLNKCKDLPPIETLPKVKDSVNEFVGQAEQFDDLTMLGFTYLK